MRRGADRKVVLVPTMGALHHGHEALIKGARRLAGSSGEVVVSIFVNPTQFGKNEDLSRYPRTWKKDLAVCRRCGVDGVFAPSVEEVYRDGHSVFVEEGDLSVVLCGASRPGHFRGVCTVVAKLFLLVRPDVAVFGEKDWQQLAVIRRMVRDLNFDVRVVGQETVREPDGLAMSSRNRYLCAEDRAVAGKIYEALAEGARRATGNSVLRTGKRLLNKIPGVAVEYLELVDAETLNRSHSKTRPLRLLTAVRLGGTRLIDNVAVSFQES